MFCIENRGDGFNLWNINNIFILSYLPSYKYKILKYLLDLMKSNTVQEAHAPLKRYIA